MRGTIFVAALLNFVFTCLAIPLSNLNTATSNGIRLPIRRGPVGDVTASSQRRDLPVSIKNNKVNYLIDLQVGTPPQPITLSLDTGSSDVWVFSLAGCDACQGGSYDPSASTTDAAVNDIGAFSIGYFDGSGASGYYITEDVTLGGSSLTGVYLGVATQSVRSTGHYGIMGIAYDGLEASTVKYPGILDDLYNQGAITSKSYSIYLDDIEASTGSIIFGGLDNTKWSGELVSLPIIPYTPGDNVPRLQVEWTYLSITTASGATTQLTESDLSYPVAMDTGYTSTVLPVSIFNSIATYFGATGPNASGEYFVDCDLGEGHLTFGFGAGPTVTIQVPFSELVVPLSSGECLLGLLPQTNAVISFGDTFIRSAYLNYDFGQNVIGIAQSVWV